MTATTFWLESELSNLKQDDAVHRQYNHQLINSTHTAPRTPQRHEVCVTPILHMDKLQCSWLRAPASTTQQSESQTETKSILTPPSSPSARLKFKNSILNLLNGLETKGRYQAYTTWVCDRPK